MGQSRILTVAMVWMARLRARSPPRLRRWRTVRPLLAGIGQVPAREANAASLRHRPGWENDTMAWAAVTGPMPGRSGEAGGDVVHDGLQLGAVVFECAAGVVDGQGEAADLGVADGLFAAGVAGEAAAGEAGEGGVGERCTGELVVGVVAVAKQRAEPIDLRGAGHGEVATGAEQDAQCFAVAVGAGTGQPRGVEA